MIYTEQFFANRKKETDKLLHFLQECKYSGSWDTKIDLNVIIKTIANYDFVVGELRKNEIELKNKLVELSRKVLETNNNA